MNKSEIIKSVSKKFGLTEDDSALIVDKIIDSIKDTLLSKSEVQLRKFGTFYAVKRKSKKARNINANTEIIVKPHYTVKFKAGSILNKIVNE